ncbi:hypothetical protein B0H14DRAFT_3863853 [Mycena olivaceomarginata]|nr:hypothetical protein B0H14DRAFT_3863853 [Mycena olivaceomarginata]
MVSGGAGTRRTPLLEGGRIVGRVLSIEVRAANDGGRSSTRPRVLDERRGGREHLDDWVWPSSNLSTGTQSRLQLQVHNVKLSDSHTKTVVRTVKSDVADHFIVASALSPSPSAQKGKDDLATLFVRFRRGQPSFGDPPLVWTVTGETGEVRLVNPDSVALGAHAHTEAACGISRRTGATPSGGGRRTGRRTCRCPRARGGTV